MSIDHPDLDCSNLLLDEIIDRVLSDLYNDNLVLKLEHAFKAIEIKLKLQPDTQIENDLLKLLNEIRSQELE